jgi:hypothetical protein
MNQQVTRSDYGYTDTFTARGSVTVTKSDTVDLPFVSRALQIGTGGNIKMTFADGSIDTWYNVQAGIVPVQVRRVWSTDTTAAQISSVY